MGGVKAAMMEHEENLALAASYLVSIRRLECCKFHGTIYGGAAWDLEENFYKQVMNDRNRGANGPVPWAAGMKARAYTDLLKETYENHPGETCFACEKNRAD